MAGSNIHDYIKHHPLNPELIKNSPQFKCISSLNIYFFPFETRCFWQKKMNDLAIFGIFCSTFSWDGIIFRNIYSAQPTENFEQNFHFSTIA